MDHSSFFVFAPLRLLTNSYTYGMIKNLELGKDTLPKKALVIYRNYDEVASRETNRSVRGLIINVEDSDFLHELWIMANEL